MTIRRELLDEIIVHCKETYPNEACGILAGKESSIEKVYKMRNIKNSTVTYEMNSVDQLRCEREIKNAGLRIICIYHSHPSSSAYPSQVDLIRSSWPGDPDIPVYPDVCYMIIGPIDGEINVKVFKLSSSGKIDEIKLDIIG